MVRRHSKPSAALLITYFLVLSSKGGPKTTEKGKDADIKKWEAELRKTLSQKKPGSQTLSKQEKALVDAQLAKEQSTREELALLQKKIQDGLSLIDSLLKSQSEEVTNHLSELATVIVDGILPYGTPLAGSAALSTYLVFWLLQPAELILTLSQHVYAAASDRLETQRLWIAIAILRAAELPEIPENYTAEPIDSK
jgi:hypothetical protein